MSDAEIVLNEEETLRPPSIRRRAAANCGCSTLYQHWAGDQDLTDNRQFQKPFAAPAGKF